MYACVCIISSTESKSRIYVSMHSSVYVCMYVYVVFTTLKVDIDQLDGMN
jgi:hypothetical protein